METQVLSPDGPIRIYTEKDAVRITSDHGGVKLSPNEARRLAEEMRRRADRAEQWS